MEEPPSKAYGEGRVRVSVSYGEVERAAIALLKSERRPTVENLREALGHGSPETIGNALKRFWRDLGVRIEGDPAALTRMPPDIADLADGLWQRALKLASEAARNDDNAARERLAQLQLEAELRIQSFAVREREYDTAARARESALADSREHLLSLMKTLGREQATILAQQVRIADLEAQIGQWRLQLGALIAGAIAERRVLSAPLGPRTRRSKISSRQPPSAPKKARKRIPALRRKTKKPSTSSGRRRR